MPQGWGPEVSGHACTMPASHLCMLSASPYVYRMACKCVYMPSNLQSVQTTDLCVCACACVCMCVCAYTADMVPLFAGMLTQRPWDDVIDANNPDHLQVGHTRRPALSSWHPHAYRVVRDDTCCVANHLNHLPTGNGHLGSCCSHVVIAHVVSCNLSLVPQRGQRVLGGNA